MRTIVLTYLLISSLSIFSQKNLEVRYSAKKVEVDGTLVVEYSATNLEEVNLIPPKFDGFKNVQGPEVSRSMNTSIMNGHMTRSVVNTYRFYAQGETVGVHTIEGCKFKLSDGSIAESSSLQVEVVPKGSIPQAQPHANKQRRAQPIDPFDPFDIFNDPFFSQMPGFPQRGAPRQAPPTPPAPPAPGRQNNGVYSDASKIDLKKDIFARIELDKSKVYVGEQINASVKIYTSVNSNGFDAEQVPNFNGFWAQEIKLPEKLDMKREVINGREFVSIEVKKLTLFPTKSGKLTISPLKLKTTALVPVRVNNKNTRQPRDLFEAIEMMMNSNFGGVEFKEMPYTFSSGTKVVEVLPLPENAPESFTGAVGNYTLQTFVNKNKLKTDDVLQYTVEVRGTGNLPLINNPVVEWNEDFEVFDPQLSENYNNTKSFNGTKMWTYSVIPHYPGQFSTPDMKFTYFDLSSKKYVTLNSEMTQLAVTGNPTKSKKQGVEYEKFDYARQKLKLDDKYSSQSNIGLNTFYSLSIIPLLLALGVVLMPARKSESRFKSDKKVSAAVKKQMKVAESYLKKGEKENFYNETTKAYWNYVGHKLKIETSSLTRNNIEEKLKERQVSDSTIKEFISIMNNSEMGLYTSHGHFEMQKLYDQSLEVLSKLEEEIV